MNKAELIEALAGRLGDKKTATLALDAFISEVQNAVAKGDKVALTGFGSWEKRVRNPRTARNPRTGEPVKVKKTSVAVFRVGSAFRDLVASGKPVKAATAAKKTAVKATPAKTTATKATTTTAAAKKTAATKTAPAKTTATKATATKAAATKTAAAKTTAAKKTTATKATAAKTTATKATATKAT
ncbi:MAG TPA: HU family DNA-binding protein, partial [Actinoplanes sp.]|nr:HU family DNA-binding protein [Actinoplanes sp.]